MRISNISFKSGYRENETVLKNPDPCVIKALDNARPYLRQIGEAMPYQRELVIAVNDNGVDTFLSAYDYNKKNHKAKLLARKNEHNMTVHGLDFVQRVFEGLKKNNEREFKNIAADFVTKFKYIMWDQHPIKKSNQGCDDYYGSHLACCED